MSVKMQSLELWRISRLHETSDPASYILNCNLQATDTPIKNPLPSLTGIIECQPCYSASFMAEDSNLRMTIFFWMNQFALLLAYLIQ